MSQIPDRARKLFPAVSLTLLSIVQAIALELLWAYVTENADRIALTGEGILHCVKIATTLLTIVLIWLIYAGNVMRFSWVPTTADLLYPFTFGLLEFLMIELIPPQLTGFWMINMAVIFAVMVWVSHFTLRRARLDGSNANYFARSKPATSKDFIPHFIVFTAMLGAGTLLLFTGPSLIAWFTACVFALFILLWQFLRMTVFWRESLV